MWPYNSEAEAITDALRLARAMTYKAAAAGLELGGGKAVIIGDPKKEKTEALFRAYGRFVNSLGGRYITAEDIGTTPADLEYVALETPFVTGKPLHMGGSGDSAPATALGIFSAMQVCAREVWEVESLNGKTVAIQGFGKVASNLAALLKEQGARLIVSDISPQAQARARSEFGATIVAPENIYAVQCDIFAPCAMGGVLNGKTIPQLNCKVVCGGANNQLLTDEEGMHLHQRGILYAPDYVINAGGLINLSFELVKGGYNQEAALARVRSIGQQMEKVIAMARAERTTTARAADLLAEERLKAARKLRSQSTAPADR
jgi:leucine dehydrogenase